MAVAFLPSPARAVWRLGPLPVRGYALCVVAGILLAVWLAGRRYLRMGGRPELIWDLAAWAVPAGLVGARIYSVVTSFGAYFGPGRDPMETLRIWNGGLGLPGAVAAGAAATWFAAHRRGVPLTPVAGALAPGLAFGLAIGSWGDWFTQTRYGRPSALPWAVEIAPADRAVGFESYLTFQPMFLYACLWSLAVGLVVLWAARRFQLAGDRALAVCLAGEAAGRFLIQSLGIDRVHQVLGLRADQWLMVAVMAGAAAYLHGTRRRRGPDEIPPGPPALDGKAEVGAMPAFAPQPGRGRNQTVA